MDELKMNLEFARKKLLVDENPPQKQNKKVVKERANWLTLELETKKKEREMKEKEEKMNREYLLEKEKGERIEKKIYNIILEQKKSFEELMSYDMYLLILQNFKRLQKAVVE